MAVCWREVNCVAVHQVILDYHCNTQVGCSQRPQHTDEEEEEEEGVGGGRREEKQLYLSLVG